MINSSISDTFSGLKYIQPKTLAGKFIEQVQQVESEGVRKFVIDQSSTFDSLSNNTSALMNVSEVIDSTAEMPLPPEAMALMQQIMSNQKVNKNTKAEDKLLIDIENYSVLDLVVGKASKSSVIETLNSISNINYEKNIQEGIFYYSDIGLTFYFDEYNIVNEIEIDEKYKKSTSKGLKINDNLGKAIELYGKPRMKSAKGAIWNNFSILMRDKSDEIKLIRLKVRE